MVLRRIAQCRAPAQACMTTHLMGFGVWAVLTGAFIFAMTARELNTDRARALRLDDSSLNSESLQWSGAVGLLVAVLLCLVGK